MWPDLVLLLFWFRSHARCGCCSIVCLRFQVLQIKRLIAKWVLKMWIIINKRHFVIFFGQLHIQEHKATKKQIARLELNEKKSKESQARLISWYWKRKFFCFRFYVKENFICRGTIMVISNKSMSHALQSSHIVLYNR